MDFRDLLNNLLPKASRWELIGIQLGLNQDILDTIKANSLRNVEECLTEVLKRWYNSTPNPTWREVVDALRTPALDELRLAQELEQKCILGGRGKDVAIVVS